MAELLVRVIDKTSPDAARNRQCSKAGDVIAVMPDGHGWSDAERNSDFWVIIKAPGVAVDVFADMLSSDADGEGRLLRRRSRGLKLNAGGVKSEIESLGPTDRVVTLNTLGKRAVLLAARVTKPSIGGIVRIG